MIKLFPKIQILQVVLVVANLAIGAAMILTGHTTRSPILVAIAILVLCPILVFWCRVLAIIAHGKVLQILLKGMDPQAFIDAYEPFMKKSEKDPDLHTTVMNYLSTGYTARGDYDTAIRLLEEQPAVSEKNKLRSEGIRLGNLCDVYLQMGDLNRAEETWRKLEDLLEKDTEKKAGQDIASSAYTLKNYIQCLRGWDVDDKFLRQVAETTPNPYHKVVTRYQWANAQIAHKDYDGARKNLETVIQQGNKLHVVQQAQELLKSIEGKTGGSGTVEKEKLVVRPLLGQERRSLFRH